MNKYNLNWQLTRVQNRKLNLTDKLHKIRIFLSAYPSPENKELSKRGEKLDKNFDIYPVGKNKQKFLY